MSRQYPLPNDLVTADLLQAVTDGQPKTFPTIVERAAAYIRPITDLTNPNPGRPPTTGETAVITEGTYQGIQVFNGRNWAALRKTTGIRVARIEIEDTARLTSGLPGNASFKVKLYQHTNAETNPPDSKILVHYITEEYNPIPLPLRGIVNNPETNPSGSANTSPTGIRAGTDYTPQVGTLVYDPDNPTSDDFVLVGTTHYEGTITVPVAATATDRQRFQVRLFDPVNVRLDRSVGVCVIQSSSRPIVRIDDINVSTTLASRDKPDDPLLIQATTARFLTSGGTAVASAGTWETIDGTAEGGNDFTAIAKGTGLPSTIGTDRRLDVTIPAQLAEADEYFLIKVTPTNGTVDWAKRTAVCWLEGNPAFPTVVIPERLTLTSDGTHQFIEIPYFVLPVSSRRTIFAFYLTRTNTSTFPGIDYPDIVSDNPTEVVIPAGQSSGTIRIPFFWFARQVEAGATQATNAIHINFFVPARVPLLERANLLSSLLTFTARLDTSISVTELPKLLPGNNVRSEQFGQLDFPLTLDRPPAAGTSATVDWTTIGLSASPDDYGIPSRLPTGITYFERPNGEIYGQAVFTASRGR